MPSDVSIVVADVSRLAAIREGVRLPGRAMHFTSGSLASAMESVRAYRPKLVAIDALFAPTPPGVAFIERVDAMAIPGIAIRLIVQHEGRWVTTPREGVPMVAESPVVAVAAPRPVVAATSNATVVAADLAAASTRRVPRFLVRRPLDAVIESGSASLVDLSVLGAQIVSLPTLRPKQKIKVGLPDTDDLLTVIAHVAWSTFEMPQSDAQPHYRAGLEFTGAAQQALEEYRRRHCGDEPIPFRVR
jgi:PilZ domain-containing protein